DRAVDGERVVEGEASVRPGAVEADAELLDDLAANFGDRDVQADLVGPTNRQRVDQFAARGTGAAACPARRSARRARASARAARHGDDRPGCSLAGGGNVVDEPAGDVDGLLRVGGGS